MWLDTGNFSSRLSLLRSEEIEDYLYKTDINSQHLEVAGGGGTQLGLILSGGRSA